MVKGENTQTTIPRLALKSRDETVLFELEANGSLLIGSGGHCKIQLQGDGIKSLHCIVTLKDGVVELRDWNTGSTLHNGVAITEPVELQHGDSIRIFGHEIEAVFNSDEVFGMPATESPSAEQVTKDEPAVSTESMQNVSQIQVEFAETEVEFSQPEAAVVDHGKRTVRVEVSPALSAEKDVAAVDPADCTQHIEITPQLEVPSHDLPEESTDAEPVDVEAATVEPVADGSSESDPQVTAVDSSESESSACSSVAVPPSSEQERTAHSGDAEETSIETPTVPSDQPTEELVKQTPSRDFVYDVLANLNDESDQGQFDLNAPGFQSNEVQNLEDLRAENEQLKKELAQRDSEPAPAEPVTEPQNVPEPDAELLNREQALSMISRMQELVTALKNADQRNHDLEEQLRNAKAENAVPEQPAAGSVPIELVTQMRDQVQALQSKLQSTLAEANTLREQAASSVVVAEELEAAKMELSDLRLALSQEREEMVRQKSELDHMKTQRDEKVQESEDPTPVAATTEQDDETAIHDQIASLIQRVSGSN